MFLSAVVDRTIQVSQQNLRLAFEELQDRETGRITLNSIKEKFRSESTGYEHGEEEEDEIWADFFAEYGEDGSQ